MKLAITNFANQKKGEITLSNDVFGLEKREDILARAIRWQRAKKQAGTHKAKDKSEVRGTNAKPWRQKGTGRARHGSLRSPQFRGGGVTFGPVVRSHAHGLPKKVRRLAVKTALSVKAAENDLMVLESFDTSGKSKDLAKSLVKLGIPNSALFVDVELDPKLTRAVANVKGIRTLPQEGINVYDILHSKKLVLTAKAAQTLEKRFAKGEAAAKSEAK